jgi:D-alanyl-lipoteichoic acid acyltransferase DltB (MBOAT superfamily)
MWTSFSPPPGKYDAISLVQGVLGYAVQIYCDFSGYSDIAIGCARIMGFRFMENFRMPYASASITEFWRRWHISLSTWLRDYLYIPLGGNRLGRARTLCQSAGDHAPRWPVARSELELCDLRRAARRGAGGTQSLA